MIWGALAVLTCLALVYIIAGRDRLKKIPLLDRFFAWAEPYEIKFWRKSETIFKARFLQFLGLVLSLLTFIHSQDLSALLILMPVWVQITAPLLPLVINILASLDEYLRRGTTKPLEVVAIPEATAPPEVKAAVAEVEAANANAVVVVEQAKAMKEI